jgi:hypothetical protein
MSKNYIAWLQHKENLHIHNSSHGTVNTKIATKEIQKIFICISAVKNVFRLTIYKASDGDSEAENTKYFNP